MNVKDHYENHLGNFYSWMLGDFNLRQEEQEVYFRKNNIVPQSGKIALDLGAGNGIQSVSLANLGFEVKALDFNSQLNLEMKQRSEGLNIDVISCDFTDEFVLAKFKPELVTCMGDTITHLESTEQISQLVTQVNKYSEVDVLFIVSFRDLTKELMDEQRFIPVKADDNRILTCFLEYFPDYVKVTDLLYENEAGKWKQKVSCYKKLRLGTDLLRNIFACNNFNLINLEIVKGMTYLIFQKK